MIWACICKCHEGICCLRAVDVLLRCCTSFFISVLVIVLEDTFLSVPGLDLASWPQLLSSLSGSLPPSLSWHFLDLALDLLQKIQGCIIRTPYVSISLWPFVHLLFSHCQFSVLNHGEPGALAWEREDAAGEWHFNEARAPRWC